jgi:hypothetical protein
MGIGPRDWEPAVDYPPLRIVRLRSPYLEYGIERHLISGVAVPVYSIPKSLADAFRSRRFVDRSVAVECLRNAIEQRKATPAELAQAAEDCGSLSLAPNVIVLGTFTNPYVFDYPLGVSGRTAARQRQTLDALYAAFATTRIVQISVRDDSCSEAHDSPVVTGVSVIH